MLIYTFLIFRTTAERINNANKNKNNQIHNQNL
uniref:Uncharacterized protein n=1 Tax=Siphoviridae sp. ctKFk2 TaxID=2827841 RepID=A0A8S5T144_9CAUD|nr:MAG TPA: hypothetical protein [Siphoviridae sp. ctKFk2]